MITIISIFAEPASILSPPVPIWHRRSWFTLCLSHHALQIFSGRFPLRLSHHQSVSYMPFGGSLSYGSFQRALSFSLRCCATLRSSGSDPASGGTLRSCPALALRAMCPSLAVTSPFRGAYVPHAPVFPECQLRGLWSALFNVREGPCCRMEGATLRPGCVG